MTVAVTVAACAVAGIRATMPAPTSTVATVEPTSRDLFTGTTFTVVWESARQWMCFGQRCQPIPVAYATEFLIDSHGVFSGIQCVTIPG